MGPTCEWDTAAGEIIAESAGANVVNLENKTMKYNWKEDFLNPHFLVSNSIIDRIKFIKINKKPRSKEKPSDHTPIELEIN